MDNFVTIIFVAAVVGLVVWSWYINGQNVRNARVAYKKALDDLKNNPTNASLHQEALKLGRIYAAHLKSNAVTELTIQNDIAAASAGAAKDK